jgi:hypothetical protein
MFSIILCLARSSQEHHVMGRWIPDRSRSVPKQAHDWCHDVHCIAPLEYVTVNVGTIRLASDRRTLRKQRYKYVLMASKLFSYQPRASRTGARIIRWLRLFMYRDRSRHYLGGLCLFSRRQLLSSLVRPDQWHHRVRKSLQHSQLHRLASARLQERAR